jgi:nitroimidazol reductase NimA-like FMN-containing flavoprotein (pyridoxamine 5'-phosphate oxidase superfamily)
VQGEGQPYGALVAFAFSEDLRRAVFATPVTTRKFRLLSECDRVALVVDDRLNQTGELMEIEAVTATGRSTLLDRNDRFDRWADLLVSKHPNLKSFVKAQSCALFLVDIVRFFHVSRFQEVNQWIPTDHS